jgi:hypothetical protein
MLGVRYLVMVVVQSRLMEELGKGGDVHGLILVSTRGQGAAP